MEVEVRGPVLDEVLRHLDLPDVVVQGPGLGQHRVRLDLLGGLLGQRGHDEGVVVGAGRLERHLAEDRQVRVRQLEELGRRDEAEDGLEDGQEDEGQPRAQGAADEAHQGLRGDLAEAADPLPDEMDRDDDDDVDRGDDEDPRPQGRGPAVALIDLDAVDGRDPADEAEDHEEVVRAEHVAGHQAVQDGVDEGQMVGGQEGEEERRRPGRGRRTGRSRRVAKVGDRGVSAEALGHEEGQPVEDEAQDERRAHHRELLEGISGPEDGFQVVPEGDEEQGEEQERPGEIREPARLPAELEVDQADLLRGLDRDLVALADDDLALLDRVEDGLDAHPGAGLPGLRLRLVEGDVGDEEDVGQADEQHLGPGREVQGVDLGREPLLGLLDVQDVRDADGPLLAGRSDEGEAPFELALDEQVLGQDDARGR